MAGLNRVSVWISVLSLLVILCPSSCMGDDSASSKPLSFSFHDYFIGSWDVYTSTSSPSTHEVEHDILRSRYIIQRENNTNNLIGWAYENDTETHKITGRREISIEFDTPNSGIFRLSFAPTNDEEEENEAVTDARASSSSFQDVFAFNFEHHAPSGVAISTGPWKDVQDSESESQSGTKNVAAASSSSSSSSSDKYYQFSVNGPDRFMISVISPASPSPSDGKEAASDSSSSSSSSSSSPSNIMFLGRRVLVEGEKTFFQKYGTFLMLGAFFLFNIWAKSKQGAAMARQRGAPAAGAAASSAVAAASGSAATSRSGKKNK